jgi:hypothetical protein
MEGDFSQNTKTIQKQVSDLLPASDKKEINKVSLESSLFKS